MSPVVTPEFLSRLPSGISHAAEIALDRAAMLASLRMAALDSLRRRVEMTAEIRIDGACRVHRYQVVTNPGGYVDRIEVSDGGSVTYATCGVWICHQMPWVQAEALLKQQGREVRLVPDGQPWPDLLGTPPAECTLQLADVRGRE